MGYRPNSRSLVVMKSEHTALIATCAQNELVPASGYGRIIEEFMSSVGASLGKRADTFARQVGWGPTEATNNILKLLTQQDRQIWLRRLRYSMNHPACNTLEKRCHELMGYSLPEQNALTQLVAFKSIVMLTTRYPGLRKLFIRFKPLIRLKSSKGVTDTQTAAMDLWNRAGASIHHPKWDFFRQFAAACISYGEVAGILEKTPLGEIGIIPREGVGVIEKLLHLIAHSGVYEISGLIAIRYLGELLKPPSTFWLEENYHRHRYFAGKLFQTIKKCMEDIGVGNDQSLDPTTEKISDNEAIDILAHATLAGVTVWRAYIHDLESPCWLGDFLNLTGLLLRLDAFKFAPNSCARAKEFARYSQDLTNAFVTEWTGDLFSEADRSPRTVITPTRVESRRPRSRSPVTPIIIVPAGSRRSRSRSPLIVPSSQRRRSRSRSPSRSESPIIIPSTRPSPRTRRAPQVIVQPETQYLRSRSRSPRTVVIPTPVEYRSSRQSRSSRTVTTPVSIESRRFRSRSPRTVTISAPVGSRRPRSRSPRTLMVNPTQNRRSRSRSPRTVMVEAPHESRRSRSPSRVVVGGGRSRSPSRPWEPQRRVGDSRQLRSRSPIVVQKPEPHRRENLSPPRVVVAGPSERAHSSQPIIIAGGDRHSSRGVVSRSFGGQNRSPSRIIAGGRRHSPSPPPIIETDGRRSRSRSTLRRVLAKSRSRTPPIIINADRPRSRSPSRRYTIHEGDNIRVKTSPSIIQVPSSRGHRGRATLRAASPGLTTRLTSPTIIRLPGDEASRRRTPQMLRVGTAGSQTPSTIIKIPSTPSQTPSRVQVLRVGGTGQGIGGQRQTNQPVMTV